MWAVADASLNSLTTFRKKLHYRATPGAAGGGSNMHGSNGADLDVHVGVFLTALHYKPVASSLVPIAVSCWPLEKHSSSSACLLRVRRLHAPLCLQQ